MRNLKYLYIEIASFCLSFESYIFCTFTEHQERYCVPTDKLVARWFRMWVTQPKKRVFNFFLELHIINIKYIVMKKNKSKNSIEKIRKNNKFLKLFEKIPYNNSKVGQTFVMKVSSRKKNS